MRKPAVFVSSTCFDLRQIRADLHGYLDHAGLDPVLSEYPTFPIDPDSTTVANCRKAVESRADILVLVIGGRYGSVDEQGKSVTNLEYLTARAKGIPVYVFVMRSILEILPVWKANKTSDFTSAADSTKIFEFVHTIRTIESKWVFSFDTAQDIVSTLRTQIAYLFADSLALRTRASQSGTLIERYKGLSGRELRLVIERPRAWEYLLFSESLTREIAISVDLKRDWDYNIALGPSSSQSPSEFITSIARKTSEAKRIFGTFNTLFKDALPAAFGPPGHPGDVEAIVYVASRVGALYRAALQWKLDFLCISVDEQLLKIRALVAALCDNAVAEVEAFVVELSKNLSDALNAPEESDRAVNCRLVLTVAGQTQAELDQEYARLDALLKDGELAWN